MDLFWMFVIGAFAAALFGFSIASFLSVNAYDKGYADGAHAGWSRRHHATPLVTESDAWPTVERDDARPNGKAW